MKWLGYVLIGMLFTSCMERAEKTEAALSWSFLGTAESGHLDDKSCKTLSGKYALNSFHNRFGRSALIQSGDNLNNIDTTFSVIILTENGSKFFLQTRTVDSMIVLNGYWKSAFNSGLARFLINPVEGSKSVIEGKRGKLKISGVYGNGEDSPVKPIEFVAVR